MTQETSSPEVRSHGIVRILSIIGAVLIALGILMAILAVAAAIMGGRGVGGFGAETQIQMLIAGTWITLGHVASGAICMGVGKAIRILEEIRAGA